MTQQLKVTWGWQSWEWAQCYWWEQSLTGTMIWQNIPQITESFRAITTNRWNNHDSILVPRYYIIQKILTFLLGYINIKTQTWGNKSILPMDFWDLMLIAKILLVFKTPYNISKGGLSKDFLSLKIPTKQFLSWGKEVMNVLINLWKLFSIIPEGSRLIGTLDKSKRSLFSQIVFDTRFFRSLGSKLWVPGKVCFQIRKQK